MNYKSPPMVCHKGRPKSFQAMAADACKNVRLSKRGTALFVFYASCSRGFRPALSVIQAETLINRKHIPNVRSELISKGMIGYGAEFGNCIYIDWQRIKTFAMLECPLQYNKAIPQQFFSPVKKARAVSSRTIGELGKEYIVHNPRPLTTQESKFFDMVDKMTEREYEEMVISFPEYNRSNTHRPISDAEYGKYFCQNDRPFPTVKTFAPSIYHNDMPQLQAQELPF